MSREKCYFLKVFLILWKNEMESPIFLHDKYDLYDVCFHLNIYTATFLFDWWLLSWPEIWHWIFLPIQVSQCVLWDLLVKISKKNSTFSKISANFDLVKYWKKFRFFQTFRKFRLISILVKNLKKLRFFVNFETIRFWSNFQKLSILVKIFENFRKFWFRSNFRKNSIESNFENKFDFGKKKSKNFDFFSENFEF